MLPLMWTVHLRTMYGQLKFFDACFGRCVDLSFRKPNYFLQLVDHIAELTGPHYEFLARIGCFEICYFCNHIFIGDREERWRKRQEEFW